MGVEGKKRNILLVLAAEGVVPVLGGCAGAVAGGPVAGVAGVAVGRAVEKAVNLFGKEIVERWAAWLAARQPAEAAAAVSDLVTLTPADAREEARTVLLELAPGADPKDLAVALEYLSAVPRAVDRALVPDPAGGGRTVPPTLSLADPRQLLQLLPEDVPPYPTGAELPGTPYRLVELVGSGGFGAVYRAVSPTLQHLPLAIKFCLDRGLVPALNQERSNLERLMRAGGPGSAHVVRLYGYDLDHPTPFLVYEYVAGGDLTAHLAARRAALGRPPDPSEVLGWVIQLAEGLGFAHRAGLVHRDLKPANVLVSGAREQGTGDSQYDSGSFLSPASRPLSPVLKLADFGLGGVAVQRAVLRSRIGASTLDYLSLAEQASLFRGAGTPLYMSPEQRRGADPDPRHDLYALGVVWFQLLVGDVSRELPHGWAKELRVRFGVPAEHIELIERCVGWYDDRPKDANELLPLLREVSGGRQPPGDEPIPDVVRATGGLTPPARQAETVTYTSAVTPTPSGLAGPRRTLLVSLLNRLHAFHSEAEAVPRASDKLLVGGAVAGLAAGWLAAEIVTEFSHPGLFPTATFNGRLGWVGVVTWAVVGLAVWLAGAVLGVLVPEDARKRARQRAAQAAAELDREFPAEVAGWGGPAVLRDPAAVREIRDAVTVASNVTPVASTPSGPRRTLLISLLNRLHATHAEDERLARRTEWPTIARGLALGLLLGWLAGEIAYAVRHDTGTFPNAFRPVELDWTANGVGIAVGLAAWFLYWLFVGLVHGTTLVTVRGRAGKLADELVAEFPAEVAAWGGPAALRDPTTVREVRDALDPPPALPPSATSALTVEEVVADPVRKAVLVARLRELEAAQRKTAENVDGTWVGLVGLWSTAVPLAVGIPFWVGDASKWPNELIAVVCTAAGLVVGWVSWWAMAATRRHLRRKWGEAVGRFAADYPRLVETWGGKGVLQSREGVEALLKTYDPEAAVRRPGVLGRLFGR